MASVNKVILLGNLGADPELRYTPSGVPVATFNMATNERWKDKDGNDQQRTEWHRIVAWRRSAEIASEYLSKGRQVYIEGRLQTRNWEGQDGIKRYTTEIIADRLVLVGSRSGGGMDDFGPPPPSDDDAPPSWGDDSNENSNSNPNPTSSKPQEKTGEGQDENADADDDLPF